MTEAGPHDTARRVGTAFGWTLYALGAALALFWLGFVARADTSLVHVATPAAPALELAPGAYDLAIEGAPDASAFDSRVFALGTREQLPVEVTSAGGTFRVAQPGVYVVDIPREGATLSIRARERLVLSPTLILSLAIAPLATLPGLAFLDIAGAPRSREVRLGGTLYRVASVRRRLAGVTLDLVAIALLLVIGLLVAPLLSLLAVLVPLAPVLYVWAGNARGSSVGRWLTGTRVLTDDGAAPGVGRGVLRSIAWALSWGLLGAGYAAATRHPSRRAPHDLLASTFVVLD